MKFTDLGIDTRILDGIAQAEFGECTPMQKAVIENCREGKDVAVRSPEGTGKRTALIIGVFSRILERMSERMPAPESSRGSMQMMIVVPSRYGVNKTVEDVRLIGKGLPLTVFDASRISSSPSSKELLTVFVGTHESLSGALRSSKIDGRRISFLLVHEADRILDSRTSSGLFRLAKLLAPKGERQTLLAAKSFSTKVRDFIWEQMNDTVELDYAEVRLDMTNVPQRLYHISSQEKCSLLLGLIRNDEPVLTFVNTRDTAFEVHKRLEINGKKSVIVGRDLSRKAILSLMQRVKNGEVQFLVASDGEAFGMHNAGIHRIVNYDLPEGGAEYLARFLCLSLGGSPVAIDSFACERYIFNLERIEKFIGMKIPVEHFEDSLLSEDKSAGMVFEREEKSERRGRPDRHGREHRETPGRRRDERAHPSSGRSTERPKPSFEPSHAPKDRSHVEGQDRGRARSEQRPRRYDGRKEQRPEPRRSEEKPRNVQPVHEGQQRPPQKKPASLDERIKLYQEKYGEEFTVSPGQTEEKKKGKGFFAKIAGLFSKK